MTKAKRTASVKARQLVARFRARTEDYYDMGAMPPEDWGAVERGYLRAEKSLLTYIEQLEARPPTVRAFTDQQDKH